MKAPPCEFCGRRDIGFTSLWVRAQRQLRATRKALKMARHDLAVARAQQQNSADALIDANAEVRRLNALLDFIAVGRSRAMAESDDGDGSGAWMDGERPA